jgi:RNA polymerase sigma factor (TIGR02999 family)
MPGEIHALAIAVEVSADVLRQSTERGMPMTQDDRDTQDDEVGEAAAGDARAPSHIRQPGVTDLLRSWSAGDETSLARIVPLVYDELRQLARRHLRKERDGHTLRGTDLVHETFLRLVQQRGVQLDSRAQFFGWASQLMRRILVSHARDRGAAKRGGGVPVQSLEALQDEAGELADRAGDDPLPDILALDDALQRMERLDPRMGRVVELRFFGGLSVDEVAAVLQVSPSTVVREWTAARAWLLLELGPDASQLHVRRDNQGGRHEQHGERSALAVPEGASC